jgi:hypothetical protein
VSGKVENTAADKADKTVNEITQTEKLALKGSAGALKKLQMELQQVPTDLVDRVYSGVQKADTGDSLIAINTDKHGDSLFIPNDIYQNLKELADFGKFTNQDVGLLADAIQKGDRDQLAQLAQSEYKNMAQSGNFLEQVNMELARRGDTHSVGYTIDNAFNNITLQVNDKMNQGEKPAYEVNPMVSKFANTLKVVDQDENKDWDNKKLVLNLAKENYEQLLNDDLFVGKVNKELRRQQSPRRILAIRDGNSITLQVGESPTGTLRKPDYAVRIDSTKSGDFVTAPAKSSSNILTRLFQ